MLAHTPAGRARATANDDGTWNIEGVNPPGGMFESDDQGGPEMYFMVDDLDAAMREVRELGGEADEPQPTEGGRFSRCRDDQAARFGLWSPNA